MNADDGLDQQAPEPQSNGYCRREFVLFSVISFFMSGGCFCSAWYLRDFPIVARLVCCGVGLLFGLIGLMCAFIIVQDKGDHLFVCFGWFTAFGRKIRYDEISGVERGAMPWFANIGQSHLRDTETFNPGPRACVVVHLKDGGTVCIGTSDAEALCRFLEGRIEATRSRKRNPAAEESANGFSECDRGQPGRERR